MPKSSVLPSRECMAASEPFLYVVFGWFELVPISPLPLLTLLPPPMVVVDGDDNGGGDDDDDDDDEITPNGRELVVF